MGFSTIAASVILFAGLLFLGGSVSNALFEAQRETDRAQREKAERDQLRHDTRIALNSATWQGNRAHIYLQNEGDAVLAVAGIHAFIDGVYGTFYIDQTSVDGKQNTGLWSPGQELYLRIDPPSQRPARIYLVTETGVGLVAEV